MPRLSNNRIYLEYENANEMNNDVWEKHVAEIIKASEMIKEMKLACIMIKDYTNICNSGNSDGLYDLYLEVSKCDAKGKKVFKRESLKKLIGCIENARFIELGCWANDKDLIEEALSMKPCNIVEDKDIGQSKYRYNLDNELLEEILCNLINEEGEIKWFNILLYDRLEMNSILFSASHYGTEYYINRLSSKGVEACLSAVEKDYFFATINNTQL